MPLSPKHVRAAAFAFALAAAAPAPAEAGLRDSLENARDALGCTAKAVSNPMRVFESTMRNFERMTHKEFDRKANRSMKEALDDCRAAAEGIVARGFGVEPVKNAADKARDLAAAAKGAAGKVAGWFGKDSAPDDGRRALAVGGAERRFYEDAGVLGARPLPKAKAPAPPADDDAGSPAGWGEDAAPARDPWAADEDRTARAGVWDPPAEDRDPWGAAESAAREPLAPDPDMDEAADDVEEGGGYADALAALERRAEEARRREEAERRQAEREAELARQQAEREKEEARQRAEQEAEREREEAWQRAKREAETARRERREHAAALQSLAEAGVRLYAARRGVELPSTAFSTPSPSGGSGLFQADSLSQAMRDLEERNARERERQQRENERQQRQWEEQQERQRQSAQRQHQETERQQRQRQAQQERQRQVAERQRREQEAERERERQRQEAERRRRDEERRREAERRQRQQAANAATAAHCLQTRRLKGGFNVADNELRNTCGFAINVSGACVGSSFTANYPYKGTYSLHDNMGLDTLHPGEWDPQPAADVCFSKGRRVRWIACKAPFTPYFTSPSGGAYACFE